MCVRFVVILSLTRLFFFSKKSCWRHCHVFDTTTWVHGSGLLNVFESFLCGVVRYYVIYRCYVHDAWGYVRAEVYVYVKSNGKKAPPKTIERFSFFDGPLSRRHNKNGGGRRQREINDRELCENRSRKSPPVTLLLRAWHVTNRSGKLLSPHRHGEDTTFRTLARYACFSFFFYDAQISIKYLSFNNINTVVLTRKNRKKRKRLNVRSISFGSSHRTDTGALFFRAKRIGTICV